MGDFGVSRQMSDQTLYLNSFYGTPIYIYIYIYHIMLYINCCYYYY